MTSSPDLHSLPKEIAPPPGLEERIAIALRRESLLAAPPRRPWLRAAAAIVLLAAGFAIGRFTVAADAPGAANGQPRFLMLLTNADTSGDDQARAELYRQWAVAQRAAGRSISGERLAAAGLAIAPHGASAASADVQGFFVVSAASLEDAAAIARSSPHVQAGGTIIVRPIDTP